MFYAFNSSFEIYLCLFPVKYCFLQTNPAALLLQSLRMNNYLHTCSLRFAEYIQSTHGFKPCVKAVFEGDQVQDGSDLFEEEFFDDPAA